MEEKIKTCLVLTDEQPEEVTQDELKEVLKYNDGNLNRLDDFKDTKMVWGYFCKIIDYFKYSLMDMDKIILLLDENGDVYNYEHTGNYYPEHKEGKKVVGLCDENAEITAI